MANNNDILEDDDFEKLLDSFINDNTDDIEEDVDGNVSDRINKLKNNALCAFLEVLYTFLQSVYYSMVYNGLPNTLFSLLLISVLNDTGHGICRLYPNIFCVNTFFQAHLYPCMLPFLKYFPLKYFLL